MRILRTKFKVLAVRIADQAGWLSGVREDIVNSYLQNSRLPRGIHTTPRLHSLPNLSFAVLASSVIASVLLIAQFPPLQLDDIIESREQRAIDQYRHLVAVQALAEDRSSVLQSGSAKSLEEARTQLAEMVRQIQDLQRAAPQSPNTELSKTAAQLRSIEVAMKVGSADYESATVLTSFEKEKETQTKAFDINSKYSAHISSLLNGVKVHLDSSPPDNYAYAEQNGRHVISLEQALSRNPEYPTLRTQEAESRLPEEFKDWKGFVSENGKPYDSEEVIKGDQLKFVAGGIVLGSPSVSSKRIDLSSFILTYDPRSERLALVGPSSQVYYSKAIAPQTLKALNAFVLRGQTIAVSVGWSGEREMSDQKGQQVLLDPVFVDTVIGRNLVRADSLPWQFSRPTISGWQNPIAAAFRASRETIDRELPENLGAYLDRHPASSAELSALAKNDDWKINLHSCAIKPTSVQLLILHIKKRYPHLSDENVLQAAYEALVRPVRLATLYDKQPTFSLDQGQLELNSSIEYRYVTTRVEYDNKIRFGSCLLLGTDVLRLGALDELVNSHIEEIVGSFPSIQLVREYAGVAAFLRWARIPGHLQAVDFYSLLSVPAHDEHATPTPDFVR